MARSGKRTKAQLRRACGELHATFEWAYEGPETAKRAFEVAFAQRNLSVWRYHLPKVAPALTRVTVMGERTSQAKFDEAVDVLRRFGGRDVTGRESAGLIDSLRRRRWEHALGGGKAYRVSYPAGAEMDRGGRLHPRVRGQG